MSIQATADPVLANFRTVSRFGICFRLASFHKTKIRRSLILSCSMWVDCLSMSLFSELKRRNVFRAATAYVVTSWPIIQVVEIIFPVYGLSDNAIRTVITLLAIAFMPTLVFSWVFELAPKVFRREVADVHKIRVNGQVDKKLDRLNQGVVYIFDFYCIRPLFFLFFSKNRQRAVFIDGRGERIVQNHPGFDPSGVLALLTRPKLFPTILSNLLLRFEPSP